MTIKNPFFALAATALVKTAYATDFAVRLTFDVVTMPPNLLLHTLKEGYDRGRNSLEGLTMAAATFGASTMPALLMLAENPYSHLTQALSYGLTGSLPFVIIGMIDCDLKRILPLSRKYLYPKVAEKDDPPPATKEENAPKDSKSYPVLPPVGAYSANVLPFKRPRYGKNAPPL